MDQSRAPLLDALADYADVCVAGIHKMGAGFEQGSVFHGQGDLVDHSRLAQCADLLMTTSPTVMVYGAIDGWRRHMVADGEAILGRALALARSVRREIERIPGLHVMQDELLGAQASHGLDRLQVLVDVSDLGVSGCQCADWLREHRHLDVGLSDHRRILPTMSLADDDSTAELLLSSLRALTEAAPSFTPPSPVRLLAPAERELESVTAPREAFFGDVETVAHDKAAGRVARNRSRRIRPGFPRWYPARSSPTR